MHDLTTAEILAEDAFMSHAGSFDGDSVLVVMVAISRALAYYAEIA